MFVNPFSYTNPDPNHYTDFHLQTINKMEESKDRIGIWRACGEEKDWVGMRKGGRASGLNQVSTLVEVNQPPDGDGDPQITGQVEQDGRQRRAQQSRPTWRAASICI